MIALRTLSALPNLIGVLIITFLITRALPGDPAAFFAGAAGSQEAVEQIRTKLGLDKSLVEQFAYYVRDLARGDLGTALSTGRPVLDEILGRLPASLELTLSALILATAIAIPLGVLAATRPGSWIDHTCRALTTAGVGPSLAFEGALNSAVFAQWVAEQLVPTLRPGHIVILDNLSVHKDTRARQAIEAAGCHLWFLPAYSPDFNPIELVFGRLKAHLRSVQARTVDTLMEAIGDRLNAVTEAHARACFRHAGYLGNVGYGYGFVLTLLDSYRVSCLGGMGLATMYGGIGVVGRASWVIQADFV